MSHDNVENHPAANLPAIRQAGGQLSTEVRQPIVDDDVIDTGRLWRVIRRYKHIIFSLIVIFGILAFFYSLMLRPMYTATATARVNQNTSIVSVGNDVAGAVGSFGGGGGRNFKAAATAMKLIEGGGMGKQVITDLELTADAEFTGKLSQRRFIPSLGQIKKAIKSVVSGGSTERIGGNLANQSLNSAAAVYRRNVKVEEVAKTDLIRLSYTSFKPQTAARVANSIVGTFNRVESESQQALAKSAQDVLNLELANVQKRLQLSERKLTEFSRKTGIVDLEDSDNIMSGQVQSISTSLIDVQQKRRDLGVLIANTKNAKDRSALPTILKNERISQLETELGSLKSEYQQIAAVFKEDYPKLKALQLRMGSLRNDIDSEVNKAIGTMIAEYQILQDKEKNLEDTLANSNADLLDLKDRSVALNILKREWESNKNLYQGLLEKVKRAGLAANLEMNRLSLLELAQVPTGKSSPNIAKNMVMAMSAGGLIGLAIAFVMALRDRQFRSIIEVEDHAQLPVLSVIPNVETEDENSVLRERVALLSHNEPSGAVAETFRSLRTSLRYSMPDDGVETVMVTSAGPSEGKTSSIVNLAITMARNNTRVLIVDFDLRKPSIHNVFGVNRAPGVTDALVTGTANIRKTKIENLFAITAGTSCPNPTEILESTGCRNLIQKLTEDFDVVLFDSPPVMGLADALVMSQYAKILVLTVDVMQTNKDALRSAINRLHRVNAPVKGVLVTRYSADQSDDYGYDSEHYYYYNYSDYEGSNSADKSLSAIEHKRQKKSRKRKAAI